MQKLKALFRSAVETARYDGLQYVLYKMVVAAVAPFGRVGVEVVLSMDLTRPLAPRQARVPLEIRLAEPELVDRLVALQHGEDTPEPAVIDDREEYLEARAARTRYNVRRQYHQDLSIGDRCFVAWAGDEIAHLNWTRYTYSFPIVGCMFPLRREEEVYTSDAFTPDAFRGLGVHGEVNVHMLREAQREGHRIAYTTTDLARTRSRRALLRLGWRVMGRILYVAPRGLGRTFLIRLSGSYGPIVRAAR